jgi:hypothetical protein
MSGLKQLMKQSLSDDDIFNFFDNKVRIIKYSELQDINHIDDIIKPFGFCIILFELLDINNGHWTLLQKCYKNKKPYILFFDSYGYKPENELNYAVSNKLLDITDQDRGYLLRLLYNQPLDVHYNQYRLQKIQTNINTCGKYCCVKGCFPDVNEDEFAELLRSTNYTPDELICLLYEKLK